MRTQRTVGAAWSSVWGPILCGLLVCVSAPPALAEDQASKSAAIAKELSQKLDQIKLQHIAARDPEDPNRFVAAMYLPGMQIVTVSGKYAVPVLLNEKLLQRKYQDIYVDLSSASDRASRITIEDLRCDGFPAGRAKGQTGDAWEEGANRVVFDFDWRRQKLTEKDFYDKLAAADAHYARLLTLLLAEAKKGS
jgi:hypothetical protein